MSRQFIIIAISVILLAACTEGELTADFKNPSDAFRPAEADTTAEAQLRRDFREATGCYLLFNDTIQRERLGTDINGDDRYFVELLDMTYSVGLSAYISTSYTYTLLETFAQKRDATDFLTDYILPHLTGSLRPYSWFLCNVITGWNDTNTSTGRPYAITNQRCIAVATNYLMQRERTDEQKETYAQRILNIIIGQLATNNSNAFADFYTFCADYYGREYIAFGFEERPTTAQLNAIGFLSSTSVSSFPSMSTDLNSFAVLAVQYTDEQLQQMYASYPIILRKAAVVRRVLEELGYR